MAASKSHKSESRSDVRREAILKSATELFISRGYAGTSTDAIVERSGGSKQTVYAYFGDKEGLFRAAVDSMIRSTFVVLDVPATDLANPQKALREIAIDVLTAANSRENFELFRLIVAEGSRLQSVRQSIFSFETAADMPLDRLAKFLDRCAAAGTLTIGDSETYAYIYMGMLAQLVLRSLLSGERATRKAIVQHTDIIVPAFLQMCAVAPPSTSRPAKSSPRAARSGSNRR